MLQGVWARLRTHGSGSCEPTSHESRLENDGPAPVASNPKTASTREEAALKCRRGKVAPIPFDTAFPNPAPMLLSTQNAPKAERRAISALAPSGRFVCSYQSCVPGTHAHIDAALRSSQLPRRSPRTRRHAVSGAHPKGNARTAPRTPRPIHPK